MADVKVTKMVLEVDLQCPKCYKKIKKVLCRYPQIHDQVYDEKKNTVTITVVCCSPENIKQKIICKAGCTVDSIKIVPDKPPKGPEPNPIRQPPRIVPNGVPDTIRPPALPMVRGFPVPMYPVVVCCRCCCYEGRPCYHGLGPMCYDGCGRPACECSGKENASVCSVM